MSEVDDFIKKHCKSQNVSREERKHIEDIINIKSDHISGDEWDFISSIRAMSWDEIREHTDDDIKADMIYDISRTSNNIWNLVYDKKCKDIDALKNLIWNMSAFSRNEKIIMCDNLDQYIERALSYWSDSLVDTYIFCRIYDFLKDEEE